MNKTISINISGFVFNIEEGAYEKLNHYLDAIKSNFKNESERDEIMEDIEARIAELFQEQLSDRKEVIIESDVESIVEVMGKPEEYLSDDESIQDDEKATISDNKGQQNNFKRNKRLYRDENDGVIGGVCSGLGYYVGIDPVLIRIAFVVMTLLGGSGVLLYIILWIVMPNAKTTAEILEMRGESVTLDSIKGHVQDVKNSIVDNSKGAKKNIKNVVDRGVRVGSKLAKVLSKIIGLGFVIWGLFLLLFFSVVLFGKAGFIPLMSSEEAISLSTLLDALYPNGSVTLLLITLTVFVLIPVVSVVLFGVKLLLGIKTRFKKLGLSVFIVWILSIGSLVIIHVELGMNFKQHQNIDYEVLTLSDSTEVLYIDVFEDDIFSKYITTNDVWNHTELVRIEEEKMYLGHLNLDLNVKRDSSNFTIILHKESNGFSTKDAINRAEKIEFDLNLTDNRLLLSPYYIIDLHDKFRGQNITIEVQVPLGKKVIFGDNVDRISVDFENDHYRYDQDYANTTWVVDTFNEMRCIDCEDYKRFQENHNFQEFDEFSDNIDEIIDDAIDNALD